MLLVWKCAWSSFLLCTVWPHGLGCSSVQSPIARRTEVRIKLTCGIRAWWLILCLALPCLASVQLWEKEGSPVCFILPSFFSLAFVDILVLLLLCPPPSPSSILPLHFRLTNVRFFLIPFVIFLFSVNNFLFFFLPLPLDISSHVLAALSAFNHFFPFRYYAQDGHPRTHPF